MVGIQLIKTLAATDSSHTMSTWSAQVAAQIQTEAKARTTWDEALTRRYHAGIMGAAEKRDGAGSQTRTDTGLLPSGPKPGASTNFATRAGRKCKMKNQK